MKVNTLLRMYESGTGDFAGVALEGLTRDYLRDLDLTGANVNNVRWPEEFQDSAALA
jgi:hypothetical protein